VAEIGHIDESVSDAILVALGATDDFVVVAAIQTVCDLRLSAPRIINELHRMADNRSGWVARRARLALSYLNE
jgi:hypothetical protein